MTTSTPLAKPPDGGGGDEGGTNAQGSPSTPVVLNDASASQVAKDLGEETPTELEEFLESAQGEAATKTAEGLFDMQPDTMQRKSKSLKKRVGKSTRHAGAPSTWSFQLKDLTQEQHQETSTPVIEEDGAPPGPLSDAAPGQSGQKAAPRDEGLVTDSMETNAHPTMAARQHAGRPKSRRPRKKKASSTSEAAEQTPEQTSRAEHPQPEPKTSANATLG